ncbi:MAG: SMC-Scp complex subunit ScpB [Candidatus Pacebacteria bacterium]|nr:SMC-Scp complex subunit ScpB [Candidatus Paceibacterota bacterium]
MNLSSNIEAVLFFTGEATTVKELSRMLKVSETDVRNGLTELREKLMGRGIVLMENGDEIALHTAPDASDLITAIRKEELERDLGKAGLETLAIVLYQGPVTRARIDYIRGVNSAFIVRQLLVRGLVERVDNPQDQRSFLYKPTLELLSFLGISSVTELPDMQTVLSELAAFESRAIETDTPLDATTKPTNDADTGSVPAETA